MPPALRSRAAALVAFLVASSLGIAPRGPAAEPVARPAEPTVALPEPAVPLPAPPPSAPSRRTQIAVPEYNPLELYPPRAATSTAPLTVALHGRDQDPLDLCEAWNEAGRDRSWLACPAGNTSGDPSFDWTGSTEDRLAALDAQLGAVEQVYGPLVDHGPGDIVVGFSRGAFLARDLVYAHPGRYRGMVLLGAAVQLDAERLKKAGIQRVLLACGDLDDARATMVHTAEKLSARGIPARFLGLGKIYHGLPPDLGQVMRHALSWVRDDG
jgi:predicted esterase